MLLLKTDEENFKAQFDELLRRGHMDMENVSKIVGGIISEIKSEGNGALKRHIEKFDKWHHFQRAIYQIFQYVFLKRHYPHF